VYKEYLQRHEWERTMRDLGREANWDCLPYCAVMYSSRGDVPQVFLPTVTGSVQGEHTHDIGDNEVVYDRKTWHVSSIPFRDMAEKKIGDVLVLTDITADKDDFYRILIFGGIIGGILLTLFLSYVFILLYRTDAGIRLQQANIVAANQQLRASNQQLAASEQQLRAVNQVLCEREQQMIGTQNELQRKMQELENINNVMSEREMRVIDIKKEVNALLRAQGRPEKYSQGLE
jgi:hypothetical protein